MASDGIAVGVGDVHLTIEEQDTVGRALENVDHRRQDRLKLRLHRPDVRFPSGPCLARPAPERAAAGDAIGPKTSSGARSASMAIRMASAAALTFRSAIMFDRCISTVRGLRPSRRAISLLVMPASRPRKHLSFTFGQPPDPFVGDALLLQPLLCRARSRPAPVRLRRADPTRYRVSGSDRWRRA